MKRRHFVKSAFMATPALLAAKSGNEQAIAEPKEWYEWREYEFNFNSPRGEVEKYFKN